ncbi:MULTISPECIES: helix-turn-helix domain-containing protein [unclassified Kitasatospora]|uniref:helix-turn-helix transcriptional regulator n=1 Tax=unclassified Kitasatospora TaxID=2633591 RepID=UPI0033EBA886
MSDEREPRTSWTFLTNHARVLLMISRDAEVRLRDLAAVCGVTERAVQGIVTDLENAGYLTHTRHGRRNHYRVVHGTHFRHPAEAPHEIAGLLALFADVDPGSGPGTATSPSRGDHHDEYA